MPPAPPCGTPIAILTVERSHKPAILPYTKEWLMMNWILFIAAIMTTLILLVSILRIWTSK